MKMYGQVRPRVVDKPDVWKVLETPEEREAARELEVLNTPLGQTSLPARVVNCFELRGILTVRDLSNQGKEVLLRIKNVGQKTLTQCKDLFKELGIETRVPGDW